jgi:LEA14-like dessication related protein
MRFALICCGLLASCATLKSMTLARPEVHFEQARVDRVDFDGADVVFVYQVQNPNVVGLSLRQVAYQLDVDGHPLASGRPPEGFQIPPGTSEVTFPARVVWAQVVPALQSLATRDTVHYKASGTLDVETALGPLTLSLEHEGDLPAPKLPELALQQPRLLSLTPLGARLSIPLKVVNRNSFALPVAGLLGDVRISGLSVGRLELPAQGVVEAKSERTVQVPLEIGFLNAGAAVATALQSSQVEIAIDGAMTIGASRLPLHIAQTLALQR